METRKLISKALAIFLVFAIGFTSAYLLNALYYPNFELPFSSQDNSETQAPHDVIPESNIEVYKDKVIIKLDNASLSSYASTGSMLPMFNKGANGIRIKPQSEAEVQVGDIISYRIGNELIVHRVVEIGTDENGTYFIPKGDANQYPDNNIRFSDIEYVTVAILY